MKSKKNKKSKRQKDKSHKKCIIVTSEQMHAVKEHIATSGQAVFLGATITAVSLFGGGCVTGVSQDDIKRAYCKDFFVVENPKRFIKDSRVDAENPNTPANVLVKLADDKNEEVRWDVASNPNTPVNILVKLADDKNEIVRMEVAKNPNTPLEVLVKFAEDNDLVVVLEGVFHNPKAREVISSTEGKCRKYCGFHCTNDCTRCTMGCTGCTGCTFCTVHW